MKVFTFLWWGKLSKVKMRVTYRQNLFYMGFIDEIREKCMILEYEQREENREKIIYSSVVSKELVNEVGYWFNAENQYQQYITKKGCKIINSYTTEEEDSLYHPQSTPIYHPISKNILFKLQRF